MRHLMLALLLGVQTGVAWAASQPSGPLPAVAHSRDWYGIYASGNWIETKFKDKILAAPFVKGVAISVSWEKLEPEAGKHSWKELDSLMAAASAAKKYVRLSVVPGTRSPEWVLQQAEVVTKEKKGHAEKPPMVKPAKWDPTYLQHWWNFVRVLGNRYSSHPRLLSITVTGPTGPSHEMGIPKNLIALWKQKGYTEDRIEALYKDAWRKTIEVYAEAFPRQLLALFPSQFSGLWKHPEKRYLELSREIVEEAYGRYGRRLFIGIPAGTKGTRKEQEAFQKFVRSYAERMFVGTGNQVALVKWFAKRDPESELKNYAEAIFKAGYHLWAFRAEDLVDPGLKGTLSDIARRFERPATPR